MVVQQIALTLLALSASAVGAVCWWVAGRDLLQTWRALSWPVAPGTITQSQLVKASRVVIRESDDNQLHRLQLAYAYRVDGRDFTGRRIGFGEAVESPNRGWMEKTSSRYAVGRPVSVYFNPRHPEESVLVRRPTYSTWLLLGADAVALAAAAGIASLIFVRFN